MARQQVDTRQFSVGEMSSLQGESLLVTPSGEAVGESKISTLPPGYGAAGPKSPATPSAQARRESQQREEARRLEVARQKAISEASKKLNRDLVGVRDPNERLKRLQQYGREVSRIEAINKIDRLESGLTDKVEIGQMTVTRETNPQLLRSDITGDNAVSKRMSPISEKDEEKLTELRQQNLARGEVQPFEKRKLTLRERAERARAKVSGLLDGRGEIPTATATFEMLTGQDLEGRNVEVKDVPKGSIYFVGEAGKVTEEIVAGGIKKAGGEPVPVNIGGEEIPQQVTISDQPSPSQMFIPRKTVYLADPEKTGKLAGLAVETGLVAGAARTIPTSLLIGYPTGVEGARTLKNPNKTFTERARGAAQVTLASTIIAAPISRRLTKPYSLGTVRPEPTVRNVVGIAPKGTKAQAEFRSLVIQPPSYQLRQLPVRRILRLEPMKVNIGKERKFLATGTGAATEKETVGVIGVKRVGARQFKSYLIDAKSAKLPAKYPGADEVEAVITQDTLLGKYTAQKKLVPPKTPKTNARAGVQLLKKVPTAEEGAEVFLEKQFVKRTGIAQKDGGFRLIKGRKVQESGGVGIVFKETAESTDEGVNIFRKQIQKQVSDKTIKELASIQSRATDIAVQEAKKSARPKTVLKAETKTRPVTRPSETLAPTTDQRQNVELGTQQIDMLDSRTNQVLQSRTSQEQEQKDVLSSTFLTSDAVMDMFSFGDKTNERDITNQGFLIDTAQTQKIQQQQKQEQIQAQDIFRRQRPRPQFERPFDKIPETIPPNIIIPEPEFGRRVNVSPFGGTTQKAYDVFIKRGGKFKKIADDLPLNKAIQKGARVTKSTLASEFKVVLDKKSKAKEEDIYFRPDTRDFRDYRIVKGKRKPLPKGPDTFQYIERRRRRLTTKSEQGEIIGFQRKGKRRKNIFGL